MPKFNSVDPAQPYAIGGRMVNALINILNASPPETQTKNNHTVPDTHQILVVNNTENDIPAGSVVGIDGIVLGPVESGYEPNIETWFPSPTQYTVSPYDPATHADRFAVLLDVAPAKSSDTEESIEAPAAVGGVVKIRVDIKQPDHACANPIKSTGGGTNNQPPAGAESAPVGIMRLLSIPTDDSGQTATGPQWCTAKFRDTAPYGGMFAVVPWEKTESGAAQVRVLDGTSTEPDDPAGIALINDQQYDIPATTIELQPTEPTYIWLEATLGARPVIQSDDEFPAYTNGYCRILLARVVNGRIVQEHHGMVNGIIWGDCE